MKQLKVIENIFRDVLDNSDLLITENSTPLTVDGWDSIANVNILVAIEAEFRIKFTVDEIQDIQSVGDYLKFVSAKTSVKG